VRGHTPIAERTHQDGVEVAAEHLESRGRNGGPIFEVAVGSPIEKSRLNRPAAGLYDLDGLGNDFFADTVAGDDCDFFAGRHGRKISEISTFYAALKPCSTLNRRAVC